MGYQLNGESFQAANFSKAIDYVGVVVFSVHLFGTIGLFGANITRHYIGSWKTLIGKYMNLLLILSIIWQIVLIVYQYYDSAPPVFAWLFGFVAAIIAGLSSMGQIEILKSFNVKGVYWTIDRLCYLQYALLGLFGFCLWPAFFMIPTLGGVPPPLYYWAYSIGYVIWVLSTQIVIWSCAFRMGHQAQIMMETCRNLGASVEENRIRRLSFAVKFLISLVVISLTLWVVAWFAPDPDNGVAMTVFLISSSLAESSVLLVATMFKLLKYHARHNKRIDGNNGQYATNFGTQIGTKLAMPSTTYGGPETSITNGSFQNHPNL
jgi:hypothetical protein